ncbi:MAG: 2-oxo acid dehydrogenase subunit E2 [Anaerolineae bacterium]|nr:2-oxo acid dehydrogenase subunit E2 [Anaerolineae bacterium]
MAGRPGVYEIILPKLGQTVEEGRIVEWLKEEGDAVDRGDVLFTVETDKAVLDVEATRKGVLRKILVGEGELRPVLTVVGLITRKADDPLEEAGAPAEAPVVSELPMPAKMAGAVAPSGEKPARIGRLFASPRARKFAREHSVAIEDVKGTGPKGRIVERDVMDYLASSPAGVPAASPVAQRLAADLGVDLRTLTGTGPQGRIVKADVEAAAALVVPEVPVPAPAAPAVVAPEAAVAEVGGTLAEVPLSGIRAVIAQRMHESHQVTAPVTLTMEVDATTFVVLRESLKDSLAEELGFNLGYNDLLVKLSAKALRQFPYMNAQLDEAGGVAGGGVIRHLDAVHVGLAVDTERGLLVPHVSNADRKGLVEIARDIRAMAERARTGRSLPDELSGGTFTITNLGMYEVDGFTPIINYPEAAILGVGRIKATPAVVDGEITVRQMVWLSLTFDHRLVDGAPAARFLQYIKRLIEEPYLLLA